MFCIDKNYLRLRIAIEEEPFYCRFHGVFSYLALSEKLRWAQQFVFVYRPVYTLACGLKNYWVFNIFERLKHFYLPSRFDFHSRALRPLSLSLSLTTASKFHSLTIHFILGFSHFRFLSHHATVTEFHLGVFTRCRIINSVFFS